MTQEKINFQNVEEFNKHLENNKSAMEGFTTQKLNKMYEVPGFTICKFNKKIMLKAKTNKITLDDLKKKIDEINKVLKDNGLIE